MPSVVIKEMIDAGMNIFDLGLGEPEMMTRLLIFPSTVTSWAATIAAFFTKRDGSTPLVSLIPNITMPMTEHDVYPHTWRSLKETNCVTRLSAHRSAVFLRASCTGKPSPRP